MTTIRKYRDADARKVAGLISRTYGRFCRIEGDGEAVQEYVDYYDPNGKSDAEIQNLIARTPIRFVAVHGSKIVGVLRGRENRITNMFVDGDFHRQGIATLLARKLEEVCLQSGFTECVLRSSLYGVPFYKALGYKKTTGVRNFRGLGVQPMRKKLEPMRE